MIPLFKVSMDTARVMPELQRVLGSGFVGQGPKVEEFEKELGFYFKTPDENLPLVMNSCTSALDMALHLLDLSPGDEVLSTPQTCLWGQERIRLEDGTSKTISNLVNSRYDGRVQCINKDGTLTFKRVTGWHKSRLNGREWVHVSFEGAYRKSGPNVGGVTDGVWVTDDHPMLTTVGYVKAGELSSEHKLILSYGGLHPEQVDLLVGSMLGDGSLSGGRRLSILHAEDQEEWLLKKRAFLGTHSGAVLSRPARPGHQATVGFQTLESPVFRQFYSCFYPSGRKVVPEYITTADLSPRVLATWYMDDGSANGNSSGELCTESFTHAEVDRLVLLLIAKGYQVRKFGDKKPRIRILSNALGNGKWRADKFFEDIAPYVVPSLRYKLPRLVDEAFPYDEQKWAPPKTEPRCLATPLVTKGSRPGYADKRDVFCIDVEDNHNFVTTSGVIAHNCLATNTVIHNRGLRIVWVDIDSVTGNMDPASLVRVARAHPKARAVMTVDWAGRCSVTKELVMAAGGLPIIQDAAHSFLGRYDGQSIVYAGADFICWSFQAIKHLTTGDGGALWCKHPWLRDRAKLLRWYGLDRTTGTAMRCTQEIPEVGFKYQMNDIAATIGLGNLQMAYINVAAHRINASELTKRISNKKISLAPYDWGSSNWIFTILVKNGARDEFIPYCQSKGIEASLVHVRNDQQRSLNAIDGEVFWQGGMQGLKTFSEEQISIPCGWWMGESEVRYVAEVVNGF